MVDKVKNKGAFAYARIIAPWLFVLLYLWVLFVVPAPGISGEISWYMALPVAGVFWLLFILPVAFCLSAVIDFSRIVALLILDTMLFLLK